MLVCFFNCNNGIKCFKNVLGSSEVSKEHFDHQLSTVYNISYSTNQEQVVCKPRSAFLPLVCGNCLTIATRAGFCKTESKLNFLF